MSGNDPGSDATATGIQTHADYPAGTLLADRFRIESILGVGGMGVVYLATDLALGVPVALKLLRPELAHRQDAFERFRQELLLARQVSSPRVVRIHDLAQHQGRWLISMDYVDGQSLDHHLDSHAPLPVEDALRLARQIAEGLAAAHARGVVHRDLKPANILLDTQGNAYISDFGVARSLATSGQTRTGAVVGTPDYLSPEQARGEHVDARSDLYALGLMLYEMLTGKPAFAGGTVAEVLAQRMLKVPASVTHGRADVPAWVARLVDRLLRPQAAHRFQSAGEVIAAIDRREVPRRVYADYIRPHALLLAIATIVLLMLATLGWWQLRDRAATLALSPPLERLLVLPITQAGATDARLVALSAHLRDALAAIPGFAVVDRERTQQALRQLDPDGNARLDIDTLQRIAAAKRVLQSSLVGTQGRWHVQSRLFTAGQAPLTLTGPPAADPVAAVQAWVDRTGTTRALGLQPHAINLALPQPVAALDAYGAGLQAQQRGQLVVSLGKLTTATTLAPRYAAAWLAQAQTALMVGEQDKAADAIEQGQRAAIKDPQSLQRRFTAQRALIEGDAPAAVAQWRALLAATPDDTDAELNLARAQGSGGDFTTALAGLKQLTQRDGGDPRAWFELGKFSILSGDAQHAVDDYLVRALVQFKRSRDLYGQAETVNALGIGYGRLGQSADAAEQYRKAVELRRALGNRRGEATSLRNLSNALAMTGKFDEAAKDLEQARALHAALGDREGLAAVENELGLLWEERGDYPQALQAFRRALKAWQDVEDPLGIAQAQNDIGFAQYQLGNYNDAQVYLQQAASDYVKLGDQTGQIRADQDLGLLAIARGRWNEARQRLLRSLASAERRQMPEEAAVSRRHLAELELQQGHLQAAIEQSGKAEHSFRQRQDPRGASDAGLLHVDALLAAHADKDAQAALDALASVLAESPSEQRAIALLQHAELAARRKDKPATALALHQARQLTAVSGIRQLQLRIALDRARLLAAPTAGLDDATAALGHVGLRLQWLELAMRQSLAAHAPALAVAAYNEATVLLRGGDSLHAYTVHALGASARRAGGDAAGAAAAQARADEAVATLHAAMPQALLPGFDAATHKQSLP